MNLRTVRQRLYLTLLLGTVITSGCIATPAVPLDTLSYPAQVTGREKNLLVLLRGIGASHHVFAEEGIIDEIKRRRLPFDVVAPDTVEEWQITRIHEKLKRLEEIRRDGLDLDSHIGDDIRHA